MKTWKNSGKLFLIVSCLCLAPVACKHQDPTKTIIPAVFIDKEPSWDNNEQNSGLISYVVGKGFLITTNAANRYNGLIELYGKDMLPPLEKNYGLSFDTDGQIYMSKSAMVEFAVMSQKYKLRKNVKF